MSCTPRKRKEKNINKQTFKTKAIENQLNNQTFKTRAIENQLNNQTFKTKAIENQLNNQTFTTKAIENQLNNQTFQKKQKELWEIISIAKKLHHFEVTIKPSKLTSCNLEMEKQEKKNAR